jgi:hypothetical protein
VSGFTQILCKTKKFLSTSRVLQEFVVPRGAPNTLSKLDSDKRVLATYAYLDRSPISAETHMVVEHLDKAALGRVHARMIGVSAC